MIRDAFIKALTPITFMVLFLIIGLAPLYVMYGIIDRNIPVKSDGQTSFEPTISKTGDWIKMKANCDLIAVMSACPQDMNPINGVGCSPTEVSFSFEN